MQERRWVCRMGGGCVGGRWVCRMGGGCVGGRWVCRRGGGCAGEEVGYDVLGIGFHLLEWPCWSG